MSHLDPTLHDKLIEFLAAIYAGVRWRRMRTRHSSYDIWQHRLYAAATRPTLGEFGSRLCNMLGIQALPLGAARLLVELKPYEDDLLDLIHRESNSLATLSALRASERKADRREREVTS